MAAPDLHAPVSEAEYLAFEVDQEEKHEFVNGEILAMAGASDAHCRLQVNLSGLMFMWLRGKSCRVNSPDLRVRIKETGFYAYPDLTVVCGKAEYAPTKPPSLLNPVLIVEVLSESSADYDLGAKAAHYRLRPSVNTLLFVDSRRQYIQLQERLADGSWRLTEQTDGVISLLGHAISLGELYADVTLTGMDEPHSDEENKSEGHEDLEEGDEGGVC